MLCLESLAPLAGWVGWVPTRLRINRMIVSTVNVKLVLYSIDSEIELLALELDVA